mmetsp:Transcript_36109/g.115939  ORF Transcript_36109/g.115939 Transcript_36109/m.115939 type:complete len:282 (+) Transcript_36109:1618-2463(+)
MSGDGAPPCGSNHSGPPARHLPRQRGSAHGLRRHSSRNRPSCTSCSNTYVDCRRMPRRCASAARSPPASCWQPSSAPARSISASSAQMASAVLVPPRPESISTLCDTPPVKSTSISDTRPVRSASYEPWCRAYALISSAKVSCRGSTHAPARAQPAAVGILSSVMTGCQLSQCQNRVARTPRLEWSPGTKQRSSRSGDCARTARAPSSQLPTLALPPAALSPPTMSAQSSSRGASTVSAPTGASSPPGASSPGRNHSTLTPPPPSRGASTSPMIRWIAASS